MPGGRALAQDSIDRHVASLKRVGTPATGMPMSNASIPEKLFDASASFKVFTSLVAMHLDDAWRRRFFRSLDSLLDPEEWDDQDLPPVLASYQTLLRFLLLVKPPKRPGLGVDGRGNLIAAWTAGGDRLTMTCLADDKVVWTLRCQFGDDLVRAAGENKIGLMQSVLTPYQPERWFVHAQ